MIFGTEAISPFEIPGGIAVIQTPALPSQVYKVLAIGDTWFSVTSCAYLDNPETFIPVSLDGDVRREWIAPRGGLVFPARPDLRLKQGTRVVIYIQRMAGGIMAKPREGVMSWDSRAMQIAASMSGLGDGRMQTFTGVVFNLLDPEPMKIVPRDIAHSLSMQCRFGGHTVHHYSVAQHSVLIARALADAGHGLLPQMWGLLHDATEAYVVDLPRPVKALLPGYKVIENMVHRVVAKRFHLPEKVPPVVKEFDSRILLDESDQLLNGGRSFDWGIDLEPLGITIAEWRPWNAEEIWLEHFDRLWFNYMAEGAPEDPTVV